MRSMKSNVVFASVRRNRELSRDGFIGYAGSRHFSATPLSICQNSDPVERAASNAEERGD